MRSPTQIETIGMSQSFSSRLLIVRDVHLDIEKLLWLEVVSMPKKSDGKSDKNSTAYGCANAVT
jgi:hypothetical protein